MSERLALEFDSPEKAVEAAKRLHGHRLTLHSPFPVPEIEEIIGIPRTRIPYLAFIVGATGGIGAITFQWWANERGYPLNVGGRWLAPARVPIGFEITVLTASIVIFLVVLLRSRMPRLHDPLFDVPGFERASVDRFWLVGDVKREDVNHLEALSVHEVKS